MIHGYDYKQEHEQTLRKDNAVDATKLKEILDKLEVGISGRFQDGAKDLHFSISNVYIEDTYVESINCILRSWGYKVTYNCGGLHPYCNMSPFLEELPKKKSWLRKHLCGNE